MRGPDFIQGLSANNLSGGYSQKRICAVLNRKPSISRSIAARDPVSDVGSAGAAYPRPAHSVIRNRPIGA